MAAYAALVSLTNTTHQILNHPRLSTSLHNQQILSLLQKVDFLLDFVESYDCNGGISTEEAKDLESQIACAAHTADEAIESHIVDVIQAGTIDKSSGFLLDLQKLIEEMDSINEKVMRVKVERGFKEEQITYSRRPTTGKANSVVGFDDETIQLMDLLTSHQADRKIISIVGMGGLGKTTLVRNVYENLLIKQHFDILAWVTISQVYSVREILLQLLLSLEPRFICGTVDELGERLYKCLWGRRYLIVLDDVWGIDVWDEMKVFFPNNGERSRVAITTRLSNVATHCGCSCITMKFLDEDKSWNLFCETAFGHEDCPLELVEVGREIAKLCRGLPLSIVVIGGLLRKSYRTIGYWRNVSKNINSFLNSEENEQCLNILSLSYSHLPARLKPCFLYMGVFPEDREICVSLLIKLWVAEGFLKPNSTQLLEVIAEDYLKDLIDRNLILVGRLHLTGRIKSCRVHDLLRDLCSRIAEKEKFFCVSRALCIPQDICGDHYISRLDYIPKHHFDELHDLKVIYRLSRVLKTEEEIFSDALFQFFNLRFLTYDPWEGYMPELPSLISRLWNLQTLIIGYTHEPIVASSEFWKMPHLRHLECDKIYIASPSPSDEQDDLFVLGNLHTLKGVENLRFTEEVCMRIPNLRNLHITYSYWKGSDDSACNSLCNLGRLHKLESLKMEFKFCGPVPSLVYSLKKNLVFPSSLNKLNLTNCFYFHWDDLTLIGSLPQLEILKLRHVIGNKWSPVDGEFPCLKFLSIDYCDLIYWTTNSSHFPVLEKLVLKRLKKLSEIPWGIGEIPTLQLVRLEHCSVSVVISAMKIKDEQESLGNDDLQVQICYSGRDMKEFRKRAEIEGLTINNIQLEVI